MRNGTRRTMFNRPEEGAVRVRDGTVVGAGLKTPLLKQVASNWLYRQRWNSRRGPSSLRSCTMRSRSSENSPKSVLTRSPLSLIQCTITVSGVTS